ncbi:MAG: PhnD/SsuA/transferrin family substrate-binding protein [Rhodobacteraceae bacterium]|jgi:ABC-type phosphate/phosphonate transport system substrate-binding protein|nr:PhnD/SsuA/transferrin family substrate-binding protein [Paracoccaceae bacterium]
MIASLPMYDWPEERATVDALWGAIRDGLRDRGIAAPEALDRGITLWDAWLHPDLLVSQTCSLPYRTRLHGRVQLLGALDLGLPDCPPGYYRSHIVTRAGRSAGLADMAGGVFALNGFDSQSGWAAAATHAAARGLAFARFLHTGSHRDSARAVADGRADLACIDAVTWRLVERHDPAVAAALQVIDHTAPTPGLPLITAPGRDTGPIRAALTEAPARLSAAQRGAMGLAGFVPLDPALYLAVPTPPTPSQDVPAKQAAPMLSAGLPVI